MPDDHRPRRRRGRGPDAGRARAGGRRPREITAIVNVGDDLVLHGLHISPTSTPSPTRWPARSTPRPGGASPARPGRPWTMLERYGGVSWFSLGDRDLGTHLYRTQRLAEGADLAEVTAEIAAAWGLELQLVPVTDDRCAPWSPSPPTTAPARAPPTCPPAPRSGSRSTSSSASTPCRWPRCASTAPTTPGPPPACSRRSPRPTPS